MPGQSPSPFQITQAGINASVAAESMGLRITIASFKLATGFGYTPTLAAVSLVGAIVYTGTPAASNIIALSTKDIIAQVPALAGPFLFGEIGLFLTDGTLFAVATWSDLQEKSTIAVSGTANSFTFHCLLNLGVAPSIVQVVTSANGFATEYANSGMISGPGVLVDTPNAVICNEAIFGGDNLFLSKVNATRWMPHNFAKVGSGVLTAVAGGGTLITSTVFNSSVVATSAPAGTFIVQDNLGNVRVVTVISNNISDGTLTLSYAIGTAIATTPIIVYKTINTN